jgi:anti-sigma factor RsiW
MNCNTTRKQLLLLAEGSLSKAEASAANSHLNACTPCRSLYREISATLATVPAAKSIEVDPWFAEKVVQQLTRLTEEKPVENIKTVPLWYYLRMIPVAASLALAIWIGVLTGTELSNQFSKETHPTENGSFFYSDLVAEDIYEASFEAFLLTNGDNK